MLMKYKSEVITILISLLVVFLIALGLYNSSQSEVDNGDYTFIYNRVIKECPELSNELKSYVSDNILTQSEYTLMHRKCSNSINRTTIDKIRNL